MWKDKGLNKNPFILLMAEKEIARNKKAYHNFSIDEKYEAGMSLLGFEIKSLRKGKVQLKDSYISFKNGEAFIKGMNIARYESSSVYFNHEEERDRRLLLHKDEIIKIASKQKLQGYTCIPLRVYLKNGKAKLDVLKYIINSNPKKIFNFEIDEEILNELYIIAKIYMNEKMSE